MRVLHTADFHAGRSTRGYDRTPELRLVLAEIVALAQEARADAVLVAGDLFDSVNPSAEAEHTLYDFFLQLRGAGIPAIAIAGNHDSARRLESIRGLLGWVGVQLVAEVVGDASALIRTVQTRGGEQLVVAALPYLSERWLLRAGDLLGLDVGAWRQRYREGMGQTMALLGEHYRPDAVNMMMLHATLDGAKPSGQRSVVLDLSKAATISGMQFPAGTQYAALGHVHKPQRVGEGVPAHYPGSVLQLDFGEAGEQKQVNLVEVSAGRPAVVTPIELASGRTLRNVYVTPETLEARLEALRGTPDLVRVVVQLKAGAVQPGLKDRALSVLPGALAVDIETDGKPPEDGEAAATPQAGLSRLELFERYYREAHGQLPEAVRGAFLEAQAAVREAGGLQDDHEPGDRKPGDHEPDDRKPDERESGPVGARA